MVNDEKDPKERRREQIRLAQRRRRERLAAGQRKQINVFLMPETIRRLDALALLWGVERQDVIERLLSTVRIETAIPHIEEADT
ncbi:hypothetical protein HFU84_03735 [Acidithiobacillus sp. CV18-2]|nr:hypothetical protein [Acidithiobacillus sp. CV18-3]MBU2758000.1 hypothetical protein [Acidithiobacillus sp. BN09-2]MBU2776626.1 hypothetical protein [Acidithiobacillus sp. CV18-2]MBU2798639.1 hypothetical protein [Acidithiobacillus sp. VAN18-4]UTV82076.1 hypothetical protein MQE22_05495 [Acidithiobacillus sp. YTS05]